METSIRENGKMTRRMDAVFTRTTQTVRNMRENGEMESDMDEEFTSLHLVISITACKALDYFKISMNLTKLDGKTGSRVDMES